MQRAQQDGAWQTVVVRVKRLADITEQDNTDIGVLMCEFHHRLAGLNSITETVRDGNQRPPIVGKSVLRGHLRISIEWLTPKVFARPQQDLPISAQHRVLPIPDDSRR